MSEHSSGCRSLLISLVTSALGTVIPGGLDPSGVLKLAIAKRNSPGSPRKWGTAMRSPESRSPSADAAT